MLQNEPADNQREPRILPRILKPDGTYTCTFVGSPAKMFRQYSHLDWYDQLLRDVKCKNQVFVNKVVKQVLSDDAIQSNEKAAHASQQIADHLQEKCAIFRRCELSEIERVIFTERVR